MATDPLPLPNLGIQHLEYLDAVLAAPTWAVAASRVGVSPSALSQGLGELERRLGVPLFERQGRRRVLRADAAEVAAYARRVLAQTRDLARWAAEARSGRVGRLRLGMIDAAAVHHFPAAVRAFRDDRPDLDLHLTVAPSADLLAGLGRGELDLVVCVAPEAAVAGVALTPLLDEALHVHAPGPVVGEPATWGPWVAFPAGSHTRALVARAVRAAGARFDVVAESHQPEVLREMVRLGLGWAVLPRPRPGREPAGDDGSDGAGHDPADRRDGGDGRDGLGIGPPLLWRRLVAARRIDAVTSPVADALLADLEAAGAGSVDTERRRWWNPPGQEGP